MPNGFRPHLRSGQPPVLAAPQTPEYADIRFAGRDVGDFVFVRK
jgi:hypothetical protein